MLTVQTVGDSCTDLIRNFVTLCEFSTIPYCCYCYLLLFDLAMVWLPRRWICYECRFFCFEDSQNQAEPRDDSIYIAWVILELLCAFNLFCDATTLKEFWACIWYTFGFHIRHNYLCRCFEIDAQWNARSTIECDSLQ